MDCEVNKISTRRPKDFDDENSMLQFKLSQELDAVVKGHDSPAINSLVRASNDFCFVICMVEEIQRSDEYEDLFGVHLLAQKQNLLVKSRVICTLSILKLLDKTCKLLQKS